MKASTDAIVIRVRRPIRSWVNHSGLEVRWPQAERIEADVFAFVTAKSLPPFTTEQDRVEIRLTQGLSGTGDHVHNLGVTQWWSLRLHKSEIEPLDTFLDIASDFQDLLSIAVGHTAQFEKVVMHHPKLPALSFAGTPLGNVRHDITYYALWSNRSGLRQSVKEHDMYFTFDDLGGIDGVRRWLTVAADYRTELGRVMATRYREGMVLEDRIMNVSAALNSFDKHRRNDDDVHYVERIKHCIELAGRPFLDLIAQDSADGRSRSRKLGMTSPTIASGSEPRAASVTTFSPNNSSGFSPSACSGWRERPKRSLRPAIMLKSAGLAKEQRHLGVTRRERDPCEDCRPGIRHAIEVVQRRAPSSEAAGVLTIAPAPRAWLAGVARIEPPRPSGSDSGQPSGRRGRVRAAEGRRAASAVPSRRPETRTMPGLRTGPRPVQQASRMSPIRR